MAIQYLPPVSIEGHQISSPGGPDHPMRTATRRAAGLLPDGWTSELRDEVKTYFDGMAGEWHTRTSPERTAIVIDALTRGLAPLRGPSRMAVELGSGTGAYSGLLSSRFGTVIAVDLSLEMLRAAPAAPARRVQADGSSLPLADRSASAVVLINAFLFPGEVDRILAHDGAVVWVNSSGEHTPIYLPADELVEQLPGAWTGVASRAGAGSWCVLRRA